MCWAAVDRGLMIAEKVGQSESFRHWLLQRERMRSQIEIEGWNEEAGFYTQVLSGSNPDASNLLMCELNFTSADDPRFQRQVANYQRLLTHNAGVFRYRNEDDFGVPRHAFIICTFWMVDALITLGKREEARVLFEQVLGSSNHVGLLSEDINPETGELWGNFPQTYSHVGVINSAFRLSKSWQDAF